MLPGGCFFPVCMRQARERDLWPRSEAELCFDHLGQERPFWPQVSRHAGRLCVCVCVSVHPAPLCLPNSLCPLPCIPSCFCPTNPHTCLSPVQVEPSATGRSLESSEQPRISLRPHSTRELPDAGARLLTSVIQLKGQRQGSPWQPGPVLPSCCQAASSNTHYWLAWQAFPAFWLLHRLIWSQTAQGQRSSCCVSR